MTVNSDSRALTVKKATNPKQLLHKPDIATAFPMPPDYITPDEAHSIIEIIDNERNRLLFRLLWQTGLRISEALQLRIGMIKEGVYYPKRKGGKIKPVIIPKDLLNDLLNYAINQRLDYAAPLFPIGRIQAYRLLRGYCVKAGIRPLHPHLFRHGFAVNVLKQEPNLPVIQDQLGHENITTTRRYIRLIMPDVKEVISRITF